MRNVGLIGTLSLSLLSGQEAVRVDLGSVPFSFRFEGERVVVLPISLSVGLGMRIARVSTEIVFPTKFLSFIKALVKAKGAELEAKVESDAQDADKSRLFVAVAAQGHEWLPQGIIAELQFQIAGTTPDGVLELPNSPKAYAISDPSHPIENVAGDFGSIIDSTAAEPIPACFFYMH